MVDKTIINADIGAGWSALETSDVGELVHSGGVVVEAGDLTFVYLSGRTATDGDSDVVVGVGDVAEQTRQVIRNLLSALEPLGGTIDDIVRVRVYMTPPFTKEKFGQIHDARAEFFNKDHYPASTLVVVHGLARPDALIEIDADAVISKRPSGSSDANR